MTAKKSDTVADLEEIRRRAREHVERGAVTDGYHADREAVLKLLNEALATELVCTLRYKRHYFMASGIHSKGVAEEFLEHAREESEHVDMLATRIIQLDGEPNFNPDGLSARSHADYVEGSTLAEMIKEDLIAERIAIGSYTEMIRFLGNDDPTTRRLIEEILAKEEEHAEDLASLIQSMDQNRQNFGASTQQQQQQSSQAAPQKDQAQKEPARPQTLSNGVVSKSAS